MNRVRSSAKKNKPNASSISASTRTAHIS